MTVSDSASGSNRGGRLWAASIFPTAGFSAASHALLFNRHPLDLVPRKPQQMANWVDLFSLFATIGVFAGAIYGVLYIVNSISQGVATTKEALAHKGLHVSDKGVSVKTSKRFDREDYVDATQRGFIKAMNAASFGTAVDSSSSPSSIKRSDSNASIRSADEKKRKGILGMRKPHSGKISE